jgi:hypothetical protein
MNAKWQILIAKQPSSSLLSKIRNMKYATVAKDQDEFDDASHLDSEIELLARETCMPRELVARVYTRELAKLERSARIKTYVPVLIHRHVKALLREQQGA